MVQRQYLSLSRGDMQDLIDQIIERRCRAEDPDLAKISDNPYALVEYVLDHQRVPAGVLADEAADLLRLNEALLTMDFRATERRTLRVYDNARGQRLTWDAIAEAVGVDGRRQAEGRHKRLLGAQLPGGRRDHLAVPAARRAAHAAQRAAEQHGQRIWIALEEILKHRGDLYPNTAPAADPRALAEGIDHHDMLTAFAADFDGDLDELAELLPGPAVGEARFAGETLTVIGLLAPLLRVTAARPGTPGAQALSDLHAALAAHDRYHRDQRRKQDAEAGRKRPPS
ncbi:hypothetical protein AB0I28_32880 [Phytomonospora sp. NPDC050363]|uniref:hypothetical protein n=1 Tax=Phytomonospora sp. NPDC050363 TaxID=3155642 RepID=UPI0033D2623E